MASFAKHHAIIGTNTHASFHMYPQRRPIAFVREDLHLLTQMKQMVHDNLNPFLGMSFNEKEEMLILWKFCSRGTVQDIIYNDEVSLDTHFHAAFVRDITLGLEYLHASTIGYHGSLTPWCCLIDRNWMVKLTDYGIANPLERWEKQGSISKVRHLFISSLINSEFRKRLEKKRRKVGVFKQLVFSTALLSYCKIANKIDAEEWIRTG
jgi:guanylate cyclase